MRHVHYPWDELPTRCTPTAKLNVSVYNDFFEYADGGAIRGIRGGRTLLAFEGESEIIDELARACKPILNRLADENA